ncbi:MAG: hypothetical protein GX945_07540 [Lentisphaerae bacterium]|nr:hypothetical protein [Lentisphaerota bacterium]
MLSPPTARLCSTRRAAPAVIILAVFALMFTTRADDAPLRGVIPLADADGACNWQLSNAKPWRQNISLMDYSPAIGKVLQVTATPTVFHYSELRPNKPVLIARNAEEFNGLLQLDLFSDPADAMLQVCVRIQDSTGELFQYHQPETTRLRTGQWSTLTIPVGTPYKPRSNWAGNKDGVIDYPVSFYAVTIDYTRGFIGQTRMLFDQFTWTPAKDADKATPQTPAP